MDMEYFKDQICEELDGACAYAKKAIEIKAMVPNWGKMFVEMANAEIVHASNLFKMMNEYYAETKKAYTQMPEYINKLKDEASDIFAEKSAKAKYMLEMYSR